MKVISIVSVIIPCYNCSEFIEMTLKSVLEQSYEEFEIILIDDYSSDDTYSLMVALANNDKRIRVYQNERNIGVALTRNRGVELAVYEYVAFLDADDVWERDKLKYQMNLLLNNKYIDVSYTAYRLFDEKLDNCLNEYNVPKSVNYKCMLYENIIGLSTVVIKKTAFNKFKMTNNYIHEDYELWLKLLKNNFRFAGINKFLVKYRVFNSSRNASKINSLIGRLKILYYEEKINPILICKYSFVYGIRGISKYKKRR